MRVPRGVTNPVIPLLLLLLGVSILPFTAVAAGGTQAGAVTDAERGERPVESNTTIAGVAVGESVFRAGETSFVWRTGQDDPNGQRIDVALPAGVPGDYEVCLESHACKRVQNQSSRQTVSFTNVDLSANRTTVNVSLRHVTDGTTADEATLTVWWIDRDGDLDRDGVSNEREVEAGASLVLADTDDDGLGDDRELALGSDPTVVDTDGDSLTDGREAALGSDPTAVDTDGDGLADAREVELGTDPAAEDTDDDGLGDERELALGANATVADTDGDGLVDGREVALGANVTTADTDGDGLADGREADLGSDPTAVDTDGDGLADAREVELGTDPAAEDTDNDGLGDAREVELETDPTVEDTDDDGVADGREIGLGTDPLAVDTDDDGLGDAREVELGTDPTVADTDGDYLADGTEQEYGFNPTNPYTPALYGSGVLGFILGIGVALSAVETGPVTWARSAVAGTPNRAPTDDSPDEAGAPDVEPVREDIASHDEPAAEFSEHCDDGAATAGDVFERHQDALVTDAERTMRMLEAEGGKMKQSEIVESTSWSKAKVSRLLSKMDDDGDVVKVSIGRENLICLPDHTPEPAQPTDPGDVSSIGRVTTATGG